MRARALRLRFRFCFLLLAFLAGAHSAHASRAHPRVVILDDGEKVRRAADRPLDSPWPAGPVELFALRGETIALQVVVEAGALPVDDARALVEPFTSESLGASAPLGVEVEQFVERFVVVEQPTRNAHGGDSLAFTSKSAPGDAFIGAIADPLVPVSLEAARAAPHERAAIWIDLTVPVTATPGTYASTLLVRDAPGELAARPITLRVLDATLPFAAAPAFVYYEEDELTRRMGDASAATSLRELLHAHHLAAIHRLSEAGQIDRRELDFDRAALAGTAYTHALGYDGPGEGVGEGVVALGAYGTLGPPTPAARDVAAKLARALFGDRGAGATSAFVYAVDEQCDSDWPALWTGLIQSSPALRASGLRVGATCSGDPAAQAADLVIAGSASFDPARARVAEREGKWVWAYNGMRPGSGPMMLDVPATDLRANAWIAMRYGIPRWFYWEATAWFDGNRGGRGGARGFDPFTVAETFHNADGDSANGDGILVYPGRQRSSAPAMVDYDVPRVFPSVRLQNLRRGVEDSGYIALARLVDRDAANAVVARVVPRAMAWAGDRPSWPQAARPWLEARRALAAILTSSAAPPGAPSGDAGGEVVSESCSIGAPGVSSVRVSGARGGLALFVCGVVLLRRRRRPTLRAWCGGTRRKRE